MDLFRIVPTVPLFLKYYLLEVDDHSLHAPLVYDFYQHCVLPLGRVPPIGAVEALRKRCVQAPQQIEMQDLGAGGAGGTVKKRLSSIAAVSASTKRSCLFLRAVVDWLQPERILELGTSLGFSTMYLGADKRTPVLSIEGSEAIAQVAARHFDALEYSNVDMRVGPIEEQLPVVLREVPGPYGMIFVDANHTSRAVQEYIDRLWPHLARESVLVVDDIRWSVDMYQGWCTLCRSDRFSLTLDLGSRGVLFTHRDIEKQDYVLRF